MSQARHWRRWAVLGAVSTGIALVVIGLGELRGYHYRMLGKEYAMWTVGRAALDRLREGGAPPKDLNDLLQAGLLEYDSASGWLDSPGNKYGGAPPGAAQGVRLSIPPTAQDYVLTGDAVVRRDTGEALTLLTCDGVPVDRQAGVNRELARQWYSIVTAPATSAPSSTIQP